MFNIEKEFLFSDNAKYIPIHLLKTNYGFASEDAGDTLRASNSSQLVTKQLELVVPTSDSVVAMLVRLIGEDGQGEEVEQIETSTPGQSSIILTLTEGRTYWIYVISKAHVDGYIGKDLVVSALAEETERLELTTDSAEQSIDLSEDGRLELAVDVNDPTKWYNYQNSYTGPLIWSYPSNITQVGGTYNWLFIAREVLSHFKYLFQDLGLDTFVVNNKQDIINVYKIMSDIADFMKNNRADLDEQTGGQLFDFWSFLDNNFLETPDGNRGFQYMNSNFYNFMAGTGALADYMNYDGDGWNSDRGHGVYIDANARVNNPEQFNAYLPIHDFDNEIVGYLDGATIDNNPPDQDLPGDDVFEAIGNHIRSYILTKRTSYGEVLNDFNIQMFDDTESGKEDWWIQVGATAQQYYNNVYSWLLDSISQVDLQIAAAGDSIFGQGSTDLPSVAHEATLQNIRFVKDSVAEVQNNIWTTLINSNALMFKSLQHLNSNFDTKNTKVNSLTNITSADILARDIDVVYTSDLSQPGGWKPLGTSVIDSSPEIKVLNLSIPTFKVLGNYVVLVRPIQILANVMSVDDDVIRIQTEDETLDNYQEQNAFYGWNVRFQDAVGNPLGEQRIVTSSLWDITGQKLQISPNIQGRLEFDENTRVVLWSNSFIPVMIHVKIVEHDAQTLSYAQYGKKEFNTETGLCTIYDHNGNIYKRLSFGKKATEETNLEIVDFREPIG